MNTQIEGHARIDTVAPRPGRVARVLVPVSLATLMVGGAAAVVVFGVLPRIAARAALEQGARDREVATPSMQYVVAVAGTAQTTLRLPARLEARQDTSIFPREGGYITEMHADLGDHVESGQVLALIDTPVLNQQIAEAGSAILVAEARLAEATAQSEQSQVALRRLQSITDARALSAQSVDDAKSKVSVDLASVQAAKAMIESARVTRKRLEEQKALATIRAPFAGEVMQRSFDLGALVVADKTDASKPLFRITDREEVRVFAQLPQAAAMAVAPGQEVIVTLREWPGRQFKGKVVRAASGLDAAARTRLVEARLPNSTHDLLPGMFAECEFIIPRDRPPVILPGESLLIRDGKSMVAVINAESKLEYRSIQIDRDYGSTVEVGSGVTPGESVVVNLARQPDAGTLVKGVLRKQ